MIDFFMPVCEPDPIHDCDKKPTDGRYTKIFKEMNARWVIIREFEGLHTNLTYCPYCGEKLL